MTTKQMKKLLEAIEALKVVFPPPRNRSDYAEQAALFDLYEASAGPMSSLTLRR